MTTPRHVRTAAARLPGSEEVRTGAVWSFCVAAAEYARIDAGRITFWLGAEQTAARRDDLPSAEQVTASDRTPGLAVGLEDVNGMQANALLGAAWAYRAPAALQADTTPQGGGDLPTSIGRPATRALAGAGIHTLDQVAAMSPEQVAALHGIGPRAVTILAAALAERGQHWG